MSQVVNDLYIAGGVVFLFGAAIFVHEFGHFWVARKRGLKVEEFAIGFGPKIVSWQREGIHYSLRWIPAGGFVKLPQMVTSPALEGEDKKEDVPPAPAFSKMLVAAAGPAMNVVFGFLIATLIYFVGLPVPVNPSTIGYVDPKSPEAKMGIRQGDKIVALDNKPVSSWEEINRITFVALTNLLPAVIVHDGVSNTYWLKAEVNNMIGLKALNLDPLDRVVIRRVVKGSPAARLRLQKGDEVAGFAGVSISTHQQLIDLIQARGSQPTPIVIQRAGKRLDLTVTPARDPSRKNFMIGVEFSLGKDVYTIEHPTPWAQVAGVCRDVYSTVSALIHWRQSGVGVKDLSGPVGIIGVLAVRWNTNYRLALSFLVMLNINLAILNMLPIPVLDGGHILLALIERVARRPLGVRYVEYVTTVVAFLLISFMIVVTFYDIKRIPLLHFMFNRETQIEQSSNPAEAPPAAHPAP